MKEKHPLKPELIQEKETGRLIGLTDGLFATVLTLLVLDLRIPDALNTAAGDIHNFLRWLGLHLFSYLLTFLVAGTYWYAHHRDFNLIIQADRRLLGYNMMFLLFIGLLPFSTASLSIAPIRSGVFPFYWAIYTTNLIFAGVMLTLIWMYAMSHHLVLPSTTDKQSRLIIMRQITIPIVFLISIGLEYLFPQYVLGPFTLLIIPLVLSLVNRSFGSVEPKTHSGWTELFWRLGSTLPWLLVLALTVWAMTLE